MLSSLRRIVAGLAFSVISALAQAHAPDSHQQPQFISCLHSKVVRSPYVWKTLGPKKHQRIEATMPGAYLRATFREASRIALVIDGEANAGCSRSSMPIIEYSIDEQPYKIVPLKETSGEYALTLAHGFDPALPHRVEVIFRAADLTNGRWTKTASRLRIAGFQLNAGAQIEPTPRRTKRAIGFGDSITEGVGVHGEFTSWQKLEVNNARATWLPIVAAALDAEYGQLGSGGQGMVRALELPALTETWSRYDAETSRLTGGKLLPEPDYIFCAMGTNDYEKVITEEYIRWLIAVRTACPAAQIFCIVPPLQVHADEIASAVATRRNAGDAEVHLIETASLAPEYRVAQGPTRMAYDGAHPSVYGQAQLAAIIAAKAGR